jgi:hypothetical protein
MRRRDFIAILGAWRSRLRRNSSANARKLALCERTASEKWHPTYLRTLTDLMSEMGLVSRVAPVQTAVRNCTKDEGRPFGFGDQVADPKPPRAAAAKSRGGERRGNVGTMIPAGKVERGERKQTASEASKAD